MDIHSIKKYYSEVEKIIHFGGSKKEMSIRNAFYVLLNEYAKQKDLVLVPEVTIKTKEGKNVTPDGTLKDMLRQDWGYWESKDESVILDDEIRKKFDKGYPNDNILFEDSQSAVLIQDGSEVMNVSMKDMAALDRILKAFVNFERPEVNNFRTAIELFKQDIPKVTDAIREIIIEQGKTNAKFIEARDNFLQLCRESINPDIVIEDIREMMIQHILTEDMFNTIFDEAHFHRENNVARQLEKIIDTFFTGSIRRTVLSNIQHYFQAINAAAAGIPDHHEKQKFLKVVYETFYKSYNPKAADRLGVVYTPNEIVKFMIESTDYLLYQHFGKFLDDKNVEILDPASGTGTFICDIIDHISDKEKLKYKYDNEFHANEVAILPYYIANLNIEFTYKQKTGEYREFKNLCFVDTLDNMGFSFTGQQIDMWGVSAENIERIKRQNERKISVIIGNPPYNANQKNFNDFNKNRSYPKVDKRLKETFVAYSKAINKANLYDMYVRFYRWAMDRIDKNGIICLITNNSFINNKAFDGFRKIIQDEFDYAYIIDLGGNIRELSGKDGIFLNERHTIFGVSAAVGIAMMWLVKKERAKKNPCEIYYIHPCDIRATRDEKLDFLRANKFRDINFEHAQPDNKNNWINLSDNAFENMIPIIDKDVKTGKKHEAIFKLFSLGVASHRDYWVYDYSEKNLIDKIEYFIKVYNATINNENYKDKNKIAWDRELENYRKRQLKKRFENKKVMIALFRPFVSKFHYFDRHFNGMLYQWRNLTKEEGDNLIISVNKDANIKGIFCLAANRIIDLHATGDSQCLPLHRYNSKGECIENITDWGLKEFRNHYQDKKITKQDIFHYVYGVLHNPAYRKKYELNLKREFPRIPFYEDFYQWADLGRQLMDLHIHYETVEPYNLKQIDLPDIKQPKAKLKADKETGSIILDEKTTLTGVPAIAWDYKLGNRSALEWVLDQYKEKKPRDPTIAEKFNTYKFADYKEHVIDLLKRVCTVSVETMKILNQMEKLNNSNKNV